VSQPSRAIIWDLDGTLIDSVADLSAALNRLLGERGLARLPATVVRPMIGDGAARLVERAFAAAGTPLAGASLEAAVLRFLELYGESPLDQTRVFDGAVAAMDQLTRAGWAHGVCTNKPHAITTDILARLGFDGRISVVVGGDSTPQTKPHPAPLLSCLRQMGVACIDAVMIGDSAIDVLAARAAGVPVVIVTFGYSRQPVRSLGADAVVERFDELPAVVAELRSPSPIEAVLAPIG
jgi:phosphoglycolate phosphatase